MPEQRLSLSHMMQEFRRELADAQSKGQNQQPRLIVEEAEIELPVAMTCSDELGGGVQFWVLNAQMKDQLSDTITQKIRLKLKPADPNFQIRDDEEVTPKGELKNNFLFSDQCPIDT